ncbi:MAG: hypothetical protein GY765_05040 [bacterium]|nr:hypothetical protein [bacterium]
MRQLNIKKLPLKQWLWVLPAVIVILGLIQFLPASAVTADSKAGEQIETCGECHEELVPAFKLTAHAAIDKLGLHKNVDATSSCESCHGSAAKHIEDGGEANTIFYFGKGSTNDITKTCLKCHADTKGQYMAGPHGKAAMACTKCHLVHSNDPHKTPAIGGPTKGCAKCHMDVFAKFQLNNNHDLHTVGCDGCHDPHAPATATRLGGFKQETCFKCHTDKQGPFLYEHDSMSIEGCIVCHDVHGSPNRHMLKDQSPSQLCYSCHTVVPGWHSRFTIESNCTNCHATIHGSNLSSKFLK